MPKQAKFLAAVAAFWFAQYVFNPFFTPYLSSLGFLDSLAGFIVGTYGLTQMVLRIPTGLLADKLRDHKRIMLIGFALIAFAGVLLRLSPHPAAIWFARFLAGAASATWISFTVYYSGLFPSEQMGKAFGTVLAVNNLGTLLSYVYGMAFQDRVGIQNLFVCSVVAAAVGFALIATERIERGKAGDGAPIIRARDLATVLRDRNLRVYSSIAALLHFLIFATALSFTSKFAQAKLGASGADLAFLSIIYSLTGILGSWWLRTKPSVRIAPRWQFLAAFAMILAYCFVTPLCTSMAGVYVAQAFGGLGCAAAVSLTMAFALQNMSPATRSTGMGVYQSIYSIGMTAGPMVMGALLQGTRESYQVSYWAMAAACALSCAASCWLVRKDRAQNA